MNIKRELLTSARNVSACSTNPTSVKYFATSATDQSEASGVSPTNVVDNLGRVTTASLFAGGDLIYTEILHYTNAVNNNKTRNSKVLPEPQGPLGGADLLISISLALSQTSAYTVRPQIGPSVSRSVPVYSPAFAGTHCDYPRRDGQAEMVYLSADKY